MKQMSIYVDTIDLVIIIIIIIIKMWGKKAVAVFQKKTTGRANFEMMFFYFFTFVNFYLKAFPGFISSKIQLR